MAIFTIRIELRNATHKDQIRMHRRLRNLGIADVRAPNERHRHKTMVDPYTSGGVVTQYPSLRTAIGCAGECEGSYAVLITESEKRQQDSPFQAVWSESPVVPAEKP